MHYGFTKKPLMQSTFDYTKVNSKKLPHKSTVNNSTKKIGFIVS